MKQTSYLLWCLLLLGCSQAAAPNVQEGVRNSARQDPKSTPQPTDSSASEKNSTPADTIRIFFEGVVDGNAEQARSALVMNEKVEDYLMAHIDVVRAMDQFAKVDHEKFGEGGMPIGLMRQSMMGSLDEIETVMISETRAECMVSPPNPMILVKSPDGWKIDFTDKAFEQLLELAPNTYRDTAKMLDSIRESILNGTITSRSESREEMNRLIAEYGL